MKKSLKNILGTTQYIYLDIDILETGDVSFDSDIIKYFKFPKIKFCDTDFPAGKHRLIFKVIKKRWRKCHLKFDDSIVYQIYESNIAGPESFKILPDVCDSAMYLCSNEGKVVMKGSKDFSVLIKISGTYSQPAYLRDSLSKETGLFTSCGGRYKFKSFKEQFP